MAGQGPSALKLRFQFGPWYEGPEFGVCCPRICIIRPMPTRWSIQQEKDRHVYHLRLTVFLLAATRAFCEDRQKRRQMRQVQSF